MMMSLCCFIAILLVDQTLAAAAEKNNSNQKHEIIKVPLGRKLVDVLSPNNHDDNEYYKPSSKRKQRRFEIEADYDDGNESSTTSIVKKLYVEEIHPMAITSRTKYNFHKDRNFDPSKLQDIAILASNPASDERNDERGGLTIMSINKSSGKVKGFQRGLGTGSHTHSITHDPTDDNNNHRVLLKRTLGGEEEVASKNWSCDTAHAHDDDDDHDYYYHDDNGSTIFRETSTNVKSPFNTARNSMIKQPTNTIPDEGEGGWIEPRKYTYHIDLSIDVDKYFIEKQGGPEQAVEYINVLINAANVLFEHEVDAHLNIVSITEQTFYDELTTTKDALRAQRLHPRPESDTNGDSVILYHALLGRWVGGGIAFIDSICDKQWGYGVTSDLAGNLNDINDLVMFDFFIVTHEIGHSLGSGHTFDGYDPPVDVCGACTVKPQVDGGGEATRNTVPGLPFPNSATIMSYCNFCAGGISNIAITLGGVWDGVGSKADIAHWTNHPDIRGSVSNEPRRVSQNIWSKLNTKECVNGPPQAIASQSCNHDNDCDDGNVCTIDICDESSLCAVTETLDLCCGNKVCEPGEGQCSDCGPFGIEAPSLCDEDCHSLDGFMIDVGLSDKAVRRVYITSINLAYSSPEKSTLEMGATIDVYVTSKTSYIGSVTGGSYIGKEQVPGDWERITTVTAAKYNQKREDGIVAIKLDHPIPLNIGEKRGLYFFASEDIIKFGEGVYSIRNDDGVELHSSRAVSGLFGDGINGFGLNVGVLYTLDDSPPLNLSPATLPLKSLSPNLYWTVGLPAESQQTPQMEVSPMTPTSPDTESGVVEGLDGMFNEKFDNPAEEAGRTKSSGFKLHVRSITTLASTILYTGLTLS